MTMHIKLRQQHCKVHYTLPGFEPVIFGSIGRRDDRQGAADG
jgi:hypothetical protein